MKKFILLLLILFTTACSKDAVTTVLDTPTNISIEEHIIYWDKVDKASKYTLEINGLLYDSNKNSYDLTQLGEGIYSFRIKARNSTDTDSSYSEFYNYTINSLTIESPNNIKIENQLLSWDEVANAVGYRLVINNETYNIENNYYDLSLLETDNYATMIKSLSNERYKDSDYSFIIYFDKTFSNDIASQVLFDKENENDLILPYSGNYTITMNGIEVEELNYETGDNLVIKNAFLRSVTSENQMLRIFNAEASYQVTVNIIDSRTPYIISDYEFVYENQDVTLEFNVFDGNFEGLFGHNITSADYMIDDNKIMIKKEFIESVNLENIFLAYKLRNANNVSFGFILIRNGETNE